MKIEVSGCIALKPIISGFGLESMCCYSRTVGADGAVYLFFIEDSYSVKYNYSLEHRYSAIRIFPDPYSGSVLHYEHIPLGYHKEKLSFIHPIDSRLLLLGRDGRNAVGVILDEDMCEYDRLDLGPEYYDKAIVTDDNVIIIGRICEGCGNAHAIRFYDEYGYFKGIKSPSFRDVEAMNLDEKGNLWYYAYPDYYFYCTDGRSLKCGGEIYNFAVLTYNRGIIAEVNGGFSLFRFNGQTEKAFFTYAGEELSYDVCSFRQNRGILINGDMMYFFEI